MKQIVEILTHNIAPSSTVASLAANTAVVFNNNFGTGLLRSFLMKRVKALFFLKGAVAGELFLVGIARGDATVTEIKTALEQVQLERDLQDQANTRVILHDSLELITGLAADSTGMAKIEISLGGGKGIPFEEGDGWQWFIYNVDDGAASAGSQQIQGRATYYGVWLN